MIPFLRWTLFFPQVCVLFLWASGMAAGDWPNFQGPHYNGVSHEKGLIRGWPDSGPEVLWSVPIGEGFGGAAIRAGKVYLLDRIVGEKDIMRCLSLRSGKEIWSYTNSVLGRLPYPGSRGVPSVEEDVVYGISGFGIVYCIDLHSYQARWTVDIKQEYQVEPPRFGFAQSPLIYKNLLILAPMSKKVGLAALDKKSGTEVWRTEPVGHGFSTPVLLSLNGQDQLIYHTTLDRSKKQGVVSSFDPITGKTLWQYTDYYVMAPIPSATKISDDRIFLTGGYEAGSVMITVSKEDGKFHFKKVFEIDKGSQVHLPIIHQNHFYMLTNENANQRSKNRRKEGGLMCMDLEGKIKWRTGNRPNFGRGNMIYADGILILQDGYDGTLRLVEPNPNQYTLLAEADIFGVAGDEDHQMWAPMALADGKLVLRSQTVLKCINLLKNRDAATPF